MPNDLTNAHWQIPKLLHTFFQTYLLITVLAFFIGPWNWIIYDPFKLIAFLAASQVAIWVGYRLARLAASRARLPPEEVLQRNHRSIIKLAGVSALVSFALLFPTSLSRTGNLLPDLYAAWENAGRAYNENYDRLVAGNPYVVIEYFRIILAPLLIGLFPLTVIFWKKLPWWIRTVSVITTIGTMMIYFSVGTNKGIADVVVTFPVLVMLARKINSPNSAIIFTKENVFAILSIVLFLIFFGITQETRKGAAGTSGVFNGGGFIIFADSAGVAENWSTQWIIIYESITRYLNQGYQALALSFEIDTPSTLGVGGSLFFAENVNAWAGTDYFAEQSIPGQIEARFGMGRLLHWHSIYTWIASDVGYLAAIFLMMLLSLMLFLSIFLTIRYEDPVNAVFGYLLIILFFYIPANNQIFQTGETAVGFLMLMIIAAMRLPRYFSRVQPTSSPPQRPRAAL